jgi:signal transduction histidine kinase
VDARLDVEARHALYRVVQQALDNVAAHAEASRVTITVTPADRGVRFAVIDDGQGFSEQQRVSAQDKGSFGLKSMHARVTSVGGELTAHSSPGSGTQIRGWLPGGADRAVAMES